MSIVSKWLETAQNVLRSPVEFFSYEERRGGFGYPLKFALISLFLTAVISAVGALIFGAGTGMAEGGFAAALATLIGTPIMGIIGLFIGAAFIHLFVYIFGGDFGYSRTFAVLAYATVIAPISALVGLIPVIGGVLGLVVFLYGLYIEIKGIEIFQNLSTGRAAAAVILPAVILFAIFAVVAIAALSFLLGGMTPPV